MAGPWEKYQKLEASSGKPWEKYQQAPEAVEQSISGQAGLGLSESARALLQGAAGVADIPSTIGDSVVSAAVWAGNKLGISDGTYTPAMKFKDLIPEGARPQTTAGKFAGEVIPAIAGWETGASTLRLASGLKDGATGLGWLNDSFGSSLAGSLGSQLAGGDELTAKNTGQDVGINVLFDAATHGAGKYIRAAKTLISKPRPDVMRVAEEMGVSPSASIASGSPVIRMTENTLAHMAGGDAINAARDAELAQMAQYVNGIAPEARKTSEQIGRDIKTAADIYEAQFYRNSNQLYGEANKSLPANDRMRADSFGELLGDIATRYNYDPALKPFLDNPLVIALDDAYKNADAIFRSPEAQDAAYSLTGQLQNGQMSLSTARGLKNLLWDSASGNKHKALSNISDGDLMSLYHELESAIDAHYSRQGPEAQKAYRTAKEYYKEGIDKLTALKGLIGGGKTAEDVYNKIFGNTANAASKPAMATIRTLKESMRPEEFENLQSEFIRRMGLESVGAAGSERGFSPSQFLTNWNRFDEVRNDIFTPEQLTKLQNVADYSSELKKAGRLANHSNTAHYLNLAGIATMVAHPVVGIPTVLASMAATRAGANLLTNPKFMEWLMKSGEVATESEMKQHIGRLVAIYANSSPEQQDAISDFMGED